MLESQSHERSCFCTFTYEVEPNDQSIDKSHLSSTVHRLRDRLRQANREVRFFGVGEYGEHTERPHYHAAFFGVGIEDSQDIEGSWHGLRTPDGAKPGFVHVGDLTPDSASYIAGYTVKKLARGQSRPDGRTPEFALMSRRPGLGAAAVQALCEALNCSAGAKYMAFHGDVPTAFMVGGRLMPLGGYVRRSLRLFFFGDENQPALAKQIREEKFFSDNLPFVPPNASRIEKLILMEANHAQATLGHRKHHEVVKQTARNRAAKEAIFNSGKVL